MLFNEAVELLKQGKNISRECWLVTDGYITLLEGIKHVWKILTNPVPNAGNYIFSFDDLCASDWQVYDANKFIVEPPKEEAKAA